MANSLPNLLIIGAMKCGTTSLHDYLGKHPEIFMSEPKEIHFYDNLSELSRVEYEAFFKSDEKVIGTTPQSYTKAHHKDFGSVANKIFEDSPKVKLIYIVRDPFERILSHVLENRFGDSIERSMENFKNGHYWKTSLYYHQISQYLRYFPKDQIHILTLESLKDNRMQELNKIFRFLEVQEMEDENLFNYIRNDAESKDIPYSIRVKPWYRILKRINIELLDSLVIRLMDKSFKASLRKPLLSEIVNSEEVKKVKTDAEKLAKEFDLDISAWNLNPNLNG